MMMPMMGMMQSMGASNKRVPGTPDAPTVYISIATLAEDVPLQKLFTLLEAFGGVVTLRRNNKNHQIITAKMASIMDADAVVRVLNRVPFYGTTVSGKRFPNYLEKYPATDEGDPSDPQCHQFDFTAARHRSRSMRSLNQPSSIVRISACGHFSDQDIVGWLERGALPLPQKISKDAEGVFTLIMPNTEGGVKVLVEGQGAILGEEKANIVFGEITEVPSGPSPGEAQVAEGEE
jgi:hypothetical protein